MEKILEPPPPLSLCHATVDDYNKKLRENNENRKSGV